MTSVWEIGDEFFNELNILGDILKTRIENLIGIHLLKRKTIFDSNLDYKVDFYGPQNIVKEVMELFDPEEKGENVYRIEMNTISGYFPSEETPSQIEKMIEDDCAKINQLENITIEYMGYRGINGGEKLHKIKDKMN